MWIISVTGSKLYFGTIFGGFHAIPLQMLSLLVCGCYLLYTVGFITSLKPERAELSLCKLMKNQNIYFLLEQVFFVCGGEPQLGLNYNYVTNHEVLEQLTRLLKNQFKGLHMVVSFFDVYSSIRLLFFHLASLQNSALVTSYCVQ